MADNRSRALGRFDEYEGIEAAVLETERGRWFLEEHARRSRSADLNLLFDAVGRLHEWGDGEPERPQDAELFTELAAIAATAAEARRRLNDRHGGRRVSDGRAESLAGAASRMRSLAEALDEFGGPPDLAAELARHGEEISAAAAGRRLAERQIALLTDALLQVESGLAAVLKGPGTA